MTSVWSLELEYEDELGESHFELNGIFKTYDDAYWYWDWHVYHAEKNTFKNYRIVEWKIK